MLLIYGCGLGEVGENCLNWEGYIREIYEKIRKEVWQFKLGEC